LKIYQAPQSSVEYSTRSIDEVLHPLAEGDRQLYIVDSVAHLIVETSDSIIQSLHKTIKYNLTEDGG